MSPNHVSHIKHYVLTHELLQIVGVHAAKFEFKSPTLPRLAPVRRRNLSRIWLRILGHTLRKLHKLPESSRQACLKCVCKDRRSASGKPPGGHFPPRPYHECPHESRDAP